MCSVGAWTLQLPYDSEKWTTRSNQAAMTCKKGFRENWSREI